MTSQRMTYRWYGPGRRFSCSPHTIAKYPIFRDISPASHLILFAQRRPDSTDHRRIQLQLSDFMVSAERAASKPMELIVEIRDNETVFRRRFSASSSERQSSMVMGVA